MAKLQAAKPFPGARSILAIDGLRVNNLCGSGQFSGFYMYDASVQEVTYTTGAESAVPTDLDQRIVALEAVAARDDEAAIMVMRALVLEYRPAWPAAGATVALASALLAAPDGHR